MPLIPVYAARRRFVDRDGAILLEDFTFSFQRIPAMRRLTPGHRGHEVQVDPADVPAADLAAPRDARVLVLPGDLAREGTLVLLADDGGPSITLAPREAIAAARCGEHGLWILRKADVTSVEGGRS